LPYFNGAIEPLSTNVAVTANPVAAYIYRGNIYSNKGNYDRAIADYDQVIQLKPDDADAYISRGVAYGHKGNYDRAIADYDKAIQLKPGDTAAYYYRGTAHAHKGDYDEAITDYTRTIELAPNYAPAYNGLCWYGSLTGKAEKVRQDSPPQPSASWPGWAVSRTASAKCCRATLPPVECLLIPGRKGLSQLTGRASRVCLAPNREEEIRVEVHHWRIFRAARRGPFVVFRTKHEVF
jgi:tetratricopeptide (TPR) repeat protein